MSKYLYLPFFSDSPSKIKSACVQVYHPTDRQIELYLANVWFPHDDVPYVSLNDTDLSDDELIAKASYAVLAETSVIR